MVVARNEKRETRNDEDEKRKDQDDFGKRGHSR